MIFNGLRQLRLPMNNIIILIMLIIFRRGYDYDSRKSSRRTMLTTVVSRVVKS